MQKVDIPPRQNDCGFTLIELSIVLVIIGLITGGILVGRDLIAAASVRAQVTQIEKYSSAVNTFRNKYGYIPGDMPDPAATQFGFSAIAPRGTLTGQGDGNGILQSGTGSPNRDAFGGEGGTFWVDLSTAKLIDGNFTTASETFSPAGGTVSVTTTQVGSYLPPARLGQSNYVYVWSGGWQSRNVITGDGRNYFGVSGIYECCNGGNGEGTANMAITPIQAFNIDQKVDDGLPQYGRVITIDPTHGWWAPGSDAPGCPGVVGDRDAVTFGPATTIATAPSACTCYDNGGVAGTEHYSTSSSSNNGVNLTCALSFAFQ